MKTLVMILFASVCVGLASAQSAEAPSNNSNVANMFQQMTQEWEDATQARDVDRVSQIEADDLRIVGSDGKVWTKENDLDGLRSGTVKHVQADLGPMNVKMLGDDVAVVQGTLTDKSLAGAGTVTSKSMYAYIDVWERRGGKWMVVRSQYFRVK